MKTALLQGWIPLVLAMLVSSGSGMLLGAFHDRYAAMAVLVPVMNSAWDSLARAALVARWRTGSR